MAIKAGNKAVVRLLAPAGDLDAQVLLDYPEFARRVSAGEAPRLPTAAVTAVLRKARLRVDPRDASGASRAAAAGKVAALLTSLRTLGARPTAAAALDVHSFGSEDLASAYLQHGSMSAAERAEITEALAAFEAPDQDAEARRFARRLVALSAVAT
jgi:hypothetical protein